ncbi:MAG TPA: helix-turn-helix domain-containing protein [Chryseolinea sp.]
MTNPFETIESRLTSIESLLLDLTQFRSDNSVSKGPAEEEILNVKQASEFLDLATPTIYALTSNRILPHSKRGKKLYFSKSELMQWVLSGKRSTVKELKAKAKLKS